MRTLIIPGLGKHGFNNEWCNYGVIPNFILKDPVLANPGKVHVHIALDINILEVVLSCYFVQNVIQNHRNIQVYKGSNIKLQ